MKLLGGGSEIGEDGKELDLHLGELVPRGVGEKVENIDFAGTAAG